MSELSGIQAGNQRREQGWQFSLQQAENELKEIEQQIVAAEIRRDISIESRNIHEKTLEQLQETFEFYRDKFTNLGLYTWLSTNLQRIYREAYQSALTISRLAERAFRFERGDDTTPLLDGNYWDASRSGLLAGERLMNDLRAMEQRYIETHYRSMEIDQAFSLTQVDPTALIQLKETGECTFSIPELYFDLFYPGQYRRRIKSARLTIPCITGPYTNVSATLTLTGSQIRKDAALGADNLFDVPPSRTVTIATSTAQNDSGVFRLDFRDERYMPFEGAGAISSWSLSLPKNFKPFDYSTINDVILHVSYTAEYSESLRNDVEKETGHLEAALSSLALPRVFSFRQEFSQSFHSLLHTPPAPSASGNDEPVSVKFEFSEKHFPIFLTGKTLHASRTVVILATEAGTFKETDSDDNPDNARPTITVSRNGSTEEIKIKQEDFAKNPTFGNLWSAEVPATIFGDFTPSASPITLSFTVTDAGALAPVPSDPSPIGDHKLKDLYFYLEYSGPKPRTPSN